MPSQRCASSRFEAATKAQRTVTTRWFRVSGCRKRRRRTLPHLWLRMPQWLRDSIRINLPVPRHWQDVAQLPDAPRLPARPRRLKESHWGSPALQSRCAHLRPKSQGPSPGHCDFGPTITPCRRNQRKGSQKPWSRHIFRTSLFLPWFAFRCKRRAVSGLEPSFSGFTTNPHPVFRTRCTH